MEDTQLILDLMQTWKSSPSVPQVGKPYKRAINIYDRMFDTSPEETWRRMVIVWMGR